MHRPAGRHPIPKEQMNRSDWLWPWRRLLVALVFASAGVTVCPVSPVSGQELRFADLGTCNLESGQTIRECRVGYRTMGELNEDGSNAVLFPAWGGGRSEQLPETYVGPDGWVNPEEYFVVMVDHFGNGVSSSPSNSQVQPGETFPGFTIRDVVRAQHRLVTEILGLESLHAVVGLSLGGFFAFEWATTYPGFAAHVIPVGGTPMLGPYELLWSEVSHRILSNCEPDRCEEARETYFLKYIAMLMRTPGYWNRNVSPDDLPEFREQISRLARNQPVPIDKLAENTAMRSMDITAPFGGSMQQAAKAVRSRMLIIIGTHDLAVTPEASRDFAELAGARLLELDNDWGHQFFIPENDTIRLAIQEFLR